jgi:competence protein ComEC
MLWPVDPPWWLGGALFVVAGPAAFGLAALPGRRTGGFGRPARLVGSGLFALTAAAGLGASAAQWRTQAVASPGFIGGDAPVLVEGWVIANDAGERGPRLRLLVRSIEGMDLSPRYVRVSVSAAGVLTPGRAARCLAVLGPPAGPMAPGGYDFARRAYFERLAATGFAFGRCRPVSFEAPPSWLDRQRLRLAAARSDLSAAIVEAAPGRGGAIAAALVTGDRSSVDQDTNDALRDSGLGHLLSVSGIHMGVVGGLIFALVLRVLSLAPPIALRWPVKKIAAIAALATLAAYLVVSGGSVPALRAFVMACVAFGAIVIDRPAISMRGLALAAAIVTLVFPESVLEPGFQMSFAATMALVALFEMRQRREQEPALPTPGPLIGALQVISNGIGGVLLISLVAGLATDPFAIYHFQRFALYSLPANLIAAPIMSFLVAPLAAGAAALAPFGLAGPALELMASALDLVAAVAAIFGDRPEAVQALPRPPDAAFLLWVAALTWACLWRGLLRWAGLIFFIAGVGVYLNAPQPVAAFDTDLRAIFVREASPTGPRWSLASGGGRSTYARDRLGAMLGLAPAALERLTAPESCNDHSCVWRTSAGREVVFVRDPESFVAACSPGAIVISALAAPSEFAARCRPATLIDAPDIARLGGAMIYETSAGIHVTRASPPHIRRAWTPRRRVSQDQE